MLRSQDVDDLEFVVVSPGVFFPDYAPEIDDELAAELDLASADDAVVLVILTVREPVETSTANLLGPIVLNRRTRQGAQVVLSPEDHDPRRPLFAPTEAAQR